MSLSTILARLVDAEVRFVVVGAVAAVAHGSVRITLDIDLCYDDATDNRESLAGVLVDWHAYPREIDPGLPFIMDERTLRNAELLTLTTDLGPIDVMKHVPGVGDYEACRARSEVVSLDDVRFAVLSLPALIDAKREAGRPRDLEHLKELEALLELREELPNE